MQQDRFEILLKVVQDADIAPKDRLFLTKGLTYFKQQALCDLDRRKKSTVLEKEWKEFKKFLSIDSDLFKKFDKPFWTDLELKLGLIAPTAFIEMPPRFTPTPFAKYEVEDFFLHLCRGIERQAPENTEKMIILFGLYCLRAESALPKAKRDQTTIKKIWKYIHPRVQKLGFLEEFKREEKLKNSVRYFVAGNLSSLY